MSSAYYARKAFRKLLKYFEPVMLVMGIVGPLATLPQIIKLYFTHSQHAEGQSLTTWSVFAILATLWVVYGLINKKAPIYVGNGIALIMNLLMVAGIIINAGVTF